MYTFCCYCFIVIVLLYIIHADVIKWKHFPRYWPFVRIIHRLLVTSPHRGQRRGSLMFSLIYVWINCWVNNREAGDLRRNRAHYDVTVMICTFLNENVWILIKIPLKFVLKGPMNDIPALIYMMAWHRPGDKPLSEPMVVRLPTHICVARPQWVNGFGSVVSEGCAETDRD